MLQATLLACPQAVGVSATTLLEIPAHGRLACSADPPRERRKRTSDKARGTVGSGNEWLAQRQRLGQGMPPCLATGRQVLRRMVTRSQVSALAGIKGIRSRAGRVLLLTKASRLVFLIRHQLAVLARQSMLKSIAASRLSLQAMLMRHLVVICEASMATIASYSKAVATACVSVGPPIR